MTSAEAAPDYPVQFDIQRPEAQSRLTNFPLGIGTFIRYVLLIPHFIVLYVFGIIAALVYFIATFAILFSGRYPQGLFNLVVGYVRWASNLNAYLYSLFDKYPPFSATQMSAYPLSFSADYPESSSRILNFPLVGLVIRQILLIPHAIALFALALAVFAVVFVAKFAILGNGSFPEGLHLFVVRFSRWSARVTAYTFGLTDKYPPFDAG